MPFPTKGIQVDGRSEFQDAFEKECQRRGIKPFFLPACAPKLNGHLERAQRTPTEEFYEVTDSNLGILELNQALQESVTNAMNKYVELQKCCN